MLRILWNALLRQMRLVVVLGAVSALGGVAITYIVAMSHNNSPATASSEQTSTSSKQAWGDKLLSNIDPYVINASPIRVANACGLGASSCFKCHNGNQASVPSTKPWHSQHEVVNYSCAGCHQGNPRIMNKAMSHSRMIANPVQQPAKDCFSCHKSSDAQKLVDRYLKLLNKGK